MRLNASAGFSFLTPGAKVAPLIASASRPIGPRRLWEQQQVRVTEPNPGRAL
jgi:hypothetical protein